MPLVGFEKQRAFPGVIPDLSRQPKLRPMARAWPLSWVFCGVVLLKLMLYLVAWGRSATFPPEYYQGSRPNVDFSNIHAPLRSLVSYDALWYLELVAHGYSPGRESGAFYPAWPLLLKLLGCADGRWGPLVAAGGSALLWVLGIVVLFRWCSASFSSETAWSVVLANLLLPSSMTFWIGFTESLFFCLYACLLAFSDGKKPWLAWGAAFLLSLTRPVGIFLLIIPAIGWLLGIRRWFSAGCIVAFLAGWMVYFVVMWCCLGHPLAGWEAQKLHVNQPSLRYVADIPKFLKSFVNITSLHDPTGSFLDRLMFVGSFWGIIRLWRWQPTWCFATLAMLLIPAMTNQFLSFSRFTVVAIPLLFPMGELLLKTAWPLLVCWILLAMAVQYYLISQYFSAGWGT